MINTRADALKVKNKIHQKQATCQETAGLADDRYRAGVLRNYVWYRKAILITHSSAHCGRD